MKAKVKGKVIIWEGGGGAGISDQGTNGLNLFFPFTTVTSVQKTQRPARKVFFFLSDAPRPDPCVKVSSFPFLLHARTQNSARSLHSQKLSASSG